MTIVTRLLQAVAGSMLWLADQTRRWVRGFYFAWILISLVGLLIIGDYLEIPGVSLLFWLTFGVLGPLLLVPPMRKVVFAGLGIITLVLIVKFTGLSSMYVYAATMLLIGIATLMYIPLPAWLKPSLNRLLIAGLLVALFIGGVARLWPGVAAAFSTGKRFDQQTGTALAKINPSSGEIFEGDRARFQYDPRTGDALEVLTPERLRELRKIKLPSLPRIITVPVPQVVRAAPPAATQPYWDWERTFSHSGEITTDFQNYPGLTWEFWADKPFRVISTEPDGTKVEIPAPAGKSGTCGSNPWKGKTPAGPLQLRVLQPDTVVKIHACR